ncbi:helix-turn-helix domain-containing protein [Scytonema millei]|uniref:Helix-turn-helix transcriptional regulator n=1 Tax=Scytonema millei VB511283 TaxID=1245923 RepID=A0A9X5E7T5_9CYAN|nr:helix-turn-helix transcriptional regulator [Scytonema millei]NHC36896.1 helix-turn-helix transcriptional regulator [Scytonema millei VB511283]
MEEEPLAKRLGRLIRRLRLEEGLSQEEFAERCGLHRTYIGFIERGEKTITIETASKLAQALGLSLAQLFIALESLDSD